MFPQFVFLSSPSSQYEQTIEAFMKKNRFEIHEKQNHRKQLLQFASDQKFIDSPLTRHGIDSLEHLKKSLLNLEKFDTVIVSPLSKCLETCYQLFNQQKSVQNHLNIPIKCYIQPLLNDRLNSTHAISNISSSSQNSRQKQQQKKYIKFYQNSQILTDSTHMHQILPTRILTQLPKETQLKSPKQYIKLLKLSSITNEQNSLQTKQQFIERIQKLKTELLNYQRISGTNKNILIIANAEMLNYIAATGFHQNGQPVNPLTMQPGEIQLVNILIHGQNQFQDWDISQILSFCK